MSNIQRDMQCNCLPLGTHTNNRFCTSVLNAANDGVDWIIRKIQFVVKVISVRK